MIYTGTIPTIREIEKWAEEKVSNLRDDVVQAHVTEIVKPQNLKEFEISVHCGEDDTEELYAYVNYAESNPGGKEFQTELDYS